MNIFNKYFSKDKNLKVISDEKINYEVTPLEQIEFANEAVDIINPVLRQFGFNLLKINITEFGTTIIWIKNKCTQIKIIVVIQTKQR